MADSKDVSKGSQPPLQNTHPLPRRTSAENSATIYHHRLARDAARKTSPGNTSARARSLPRRNSSSESHNTSRSDPKGWFDRSNRNPTATFDTGPMDVDPPFFQNEMGLANEERGLSASLRDPAHLFAQEAPQMPAVRPTDTQSSSEDGFRSVIDDLTVENKRLKKELKRYKQLGPEMMKRETLFEIKVHGLPQRKKRELEATLREFAAGLDTPSESHSQRRIPGRHGKNVYSSRESMSKHASSSSSHSRPVDSAYASMSIGPSSNAPQSSGPSQGRPSTGSRGKHLSQQKVEHYLRDTPDGLFPRHLVLTDKEKKKLVVRRLEQLFTGKLSRKVVTRNGLAPAMGVEVLSELPTVALARNPEAAREARIQPQDPKQKKLRLRDNVSSSNSNGDQTESGGNGTGSGDGNRSVGRSGSQTSPSTILPPEQRPTRPRDLDPDRVQVPSENMDYIRHLGLDPPEIMVGHKASRQDVSPDADGWVYLNLLCNLAQMHIVNVTPSFIRSAVCEKSAKFQLSPDGRKIRWRGGSDGTKFSSDSSVDNSQKSTSTDESDGSNHGRQRKKRKTLQLGEQTASGTSSKDSKFGPQPSSWSQSFHYKPLFVQQSSSAETSTEETDSPPSDGMVDDSNIENAGEYEGSRSSQRKRRRPGGAIIYYSGAPFCTDLSGDPGDVSPTTYLTSTGQEPDSSVRSRPYVLVHRTSSGSSLPVRPLDSSHPTVSESPGSDFADISDNDGDILNIDKIYFPWCDNPEMDQQDPIEPLLEPCGLGGVRPEDHFDVLVTTHRTILSKLAVTRQSERFSGSDDIAEVIASRLESLKTSSPLPLRRHTVGVDIPVRIEYVSEKIQRLKPIALPPPAYYFPPFSTDSESGFGLDWLDSDEEGILGGDALSEALISQRANPHHSEITFPEQEDVSFDGKGVGQDDSGDEEEDDDDAMPDESEPIENANHHKGVNLVRTGSSVATAGGAESGYNSSVEDGAE
ncbi:frequency clock protein [Lasiosphaeria miniovina]|uniref:Frequency clock protein n=1 Tax=Lasiosphaeria miniovina TaxID=1954250 RepID=A0AA40AC00_9PEZI|nr:frequency clock protein [Lasiosphaeria miniovina]KAK0713112.1 frequency clock protein [Lasiosphaeria miniovina]